MKQSVGKISKETLERHNVEWRTKISLLFFSTEYPSGIQNIFLVCKRLAISNRTKRMKWFIGWINRELWENQIGLSCHFICTWCSEQVYYFDGIYQPVNLFDFNYILDFNFLLEWWLIPLNKKYLILYL